MFYSLASPAFMISSTTINGNLGIRPHPSGWGSSSEETAEGTAGVLSAEASSVNCSDVRKGQSGCSGKRKGHETGWRRREGLSPAFQTMLRVFTFIPR